MWLDIPVGYYGLLKRKKWREEDERISKAKTGLSVYKNDLIGNLEIIEDE